MNGKQLLPVGEVELINWGDGLYASVTDENIKAAILANHLVNSGIDLRFVGNIHSNAHSRAFPPIVSNSLAVAFAAS